MILLIMFLGHYSNITLFYHTHVIDGVTYCHSHFYGFDKSTNPVHLPEHTKEQLEFIQDYNQITWNSECFIPVVESPVYELLSQFFSPSVSPISLAKVLYSPLRAPPSFLI